MEFLRRFLQHVLPRGFHKVRYYGLWHPSKRSAVRIGRGCCLILETPADTTEPPKLADLLEVLGQPTEPTDQALDDAEDDESDMPALSPLRQCPDAIAGRIPSCRCAVALPACVT